MNIANSYTTIHYLFSFAILLQSIEMLIIAGKKEFLSIWSFENLKIELPFRSFFKVLFSKNGFKILLLIQFVFLAASLLDQNRMYFLAVAAIQLLICLRFRGLFNGGSDMMVFVIATGLIIGGKFGVIYIGIHTIYSYFKAGIVKIIQPSWRSSIAIGQLLGTSLFSQSRNFGVYLQQKRFLSYLLCYTVLIFELSFPLALISVKATYVYFFLAMAFHFINFVFFGLNRFFWIWMAAWPSIFYCAELIRS